MSLSIIEDECVPMEAIRQWDSNPGCSECQSDAPSTELLCPPPPTNVQLCTEEIDESKPLCMMHRLGNS